MLKKFGDLAKRAKTTSAKMARGSGGDHMKVLKKGQAMRVIFFYPGEEGTYVDNAYVTLYENGIIHIRSNQEETTTHLQNCEILWHYELDGEDRANKVRLLKPKSESRGVEEFADKSAEKSEKLESKSQKPKPEKNPDLR